MKPHQRSKTMNVLSLFDGMACGRLALERAGIPVTNYFASEIDKHAIQVAKANWPDIQHIGDVTQVKGSDLPQIDLLIGGSPCQGFSFAGKQLNFDDPRSKLFFEFVRLYDECMPTHFLLENVRMKKEYQDTITRYMCGIEPIAINSALVSAQNRLRYYWTDIPGIEQPEDKGIYLKDVIMDVGSEWNHTDRAIEYMDRVGSTGRVKWSYLFHSDTKNDKSACLTANFHKGVPNNVLIVREATKKGFVEVNPGEGVDLTFPGSKTRRGRHMKDKSNCLTAANYDYAWYDGDTIRKFTPIECERLQTVPDNYTEGVSNTQRYKMLGNGWTVDVVAHILKNIPH